MKKITVAQALKERKRLETRLQQYRSLIREQNCVLEGSKRLIDVRALLAKCETLQGQIQKIRAVVAVANGKINGKLIELAMIKDEQKFWASIPCDESSIERLGDDRFLRKEAVVPAQEVLDKNESLEDRLNTLQDEIDRFNATETVLVED